MPIHEITDQICDRAMTRFQSEVARVQEVDLGARQVTLTCCDAPQAPAIQTLKVRRGAWTKAPPDPAFDIGSA